MPALNRIKIAYALPDWASSYSRAQVLTDLVAGLSLAAFVVPESLAYASLAGLAPVAGLYCYLAAGFVYPLFGTSKQLAVGPTSAIAVVVAAGLAIAAAGDQARHAALAAATAISLGLICFAARMLRVAQISNFISDTILLGFKTGTALYIVSTQLPKLFGLHGGHGNFFQRTAYLWRELPQAHWPSVALGVFTFALFLILERLFPKRPTTIFVVGLSIAISSFFALAHYGIEVVGRLPGGLPHVSLPVVDIADLDVVISVAFACFFLAFVETSTVARTFAEKHHYEVDTERELVALGMSNVAAGLAQGFPVAGGMSQSAVNDMGGATSPVALLFNSIIIALVLLFFTGLFANLPEPVLVAIVLMAAKHLVQFESIRGLRHISPAEYWVALVALVGVLTFGVLNGVLIAAATSMALLIARASRPDIAILGFDSDSGEYVSLANRPSAQEVPHVLVMRVAQSWVYFNAENIRRGILEIVDRTLPLPKLVVIDFSPVTGLDITTSKVLHNLAVSLRAKGIMLDIALLRDEVAAAFKLMKPSGDDLDISPHRSINDCISRHGLGGVQT